MKHAMFLLVMSGALAAADFKAGVARIDITPAGPIWMSGYASRKKPSEGVLQRLWAKALAIEDARKGRAVIVTTDLIGLPREVSDVVAARVLKAHGLPRAALLLNSSHTHTGPVVRPNLITMYELDEENDRRIAAYTRELTEKLVTVIGAALGDLQPARLSYGAGSAGFAMNRREFTPKGVRIGRNPQGPVDHQVPVLRVTSEDGRLRAVLFAYACHNTTLTGEFYQLSGDYAGFAQEEVEKAHPGATALFMMLCGGDQNPEPRSSLELAESHGKTLAAEVSRVVSADLARVGGPLRSNFRMVDLSFATHSRETFEKDLADANPHKVRRAKAMLKAYDQRRPVRSVLYPIQAVRFGRGLTLLALGGEVVVDYALRVKKEFGPEDIVVAGYSNDVMCYIPSLRVLKEGGYEAVDSMIYYGQPGPFAEDVEERVFGGIHAVLKQVGRPPAKR
jgi:hypothetical protein